jgi:hypothetical protein
MRKIVEHKTLQAKSFPALDDLINNHIQDGWELYGYMIDRADYCAQAVVKYDIVLEPTEYSTERRIKIKEAE